MEDLFRTPEQHQFAKRVARHLRKPDAPLLLEGATGLGKTRAYLAPLFEAAQAGGKLAVVLPTHQLIDQLLASDDLKVCRVEDVTIQDFRPRSYCEEREVDYNVQKERARTADVLLCTSASVIIDQRLSGAYNGVTERDYILFDEADELPDAAALASDLVIHPEVFQNHGIAAEAGEARIAVEALLEKQNVAPEPRACAKVILKALDEPAWYHNVGVTPEGGVELVHKLPGRLLKKIANRPETAFISATLSIGDSFRNFQDAMGIGAISRLSGMIEPEQFGALHFEISEEEVDSDEWRQAVVGGIAGAPKPCLVVTTSHETAATFGRLYDRAIVRQHGEETETTSEAAVRLQQDNTKDTVIAAAAWAGLDTPVIWKSVIVPRIPFRKPTRLDNETVSHYVASRSTAVRRMRQVIGRGLRSPDAECTVCIFDNRWRQVKAFVPRRFTDAWQAGLPEGGRKLVERSEIEKSSYYRRLALKTYGKRCQVVDSHHIDDHQLEVHHKFPLSEGERETTVEDLAVLCANCHRLAHSEDPPLTIEAMKALYADSDAPPPPPD